MARTCDFPVFDADNHLYETRDALTKFVKKLDGKAYKAFLVGLRPLREGDKDRLEQARKDVRAKLQKNALSARVDDVSSVGHALPRDGDPLSGH